MDPHGPGYAAGYFVGTWTLPFLGVTALFFGLRHWWRKGR